MKKRAGDKPHAQGKALASREALVDVAEGAVRVREQAARDREVINTAREETAHLREDAVHLREEAARLRDELAAANERARSEAARMQVALEARNRELRAANEQLVIATVHEQELREAAEQAIDQQKEFLAMLAHELRNPLAPIRSAVGVLHRLAASHPLLTQVHDILDRQVTQMARLLDDLLDASRITVSKVNLRKHPVAVAEFVDQAVETCRPLIEARRQTLSVEIPAEPIQVDGDPARLAQALGNLLANAAKYTQEGGAITLQVHAHEDSVVLRVADNGRGIAPELLPRIFDLFTQGHDSLDRSPGGLGIGLTVVREMASLHGGTVEARSDGPGQGSEFVVTLPRL